MRRTFIILALAALNVHAVDCIRHTFNYFATNFRITPSSCPAKRYRTVSIRSKTGWSIPSNITGQATTSTV